VRTKTSNKMRSQESCRQRLFKQVTSMCTSLALRRYYKAVSDHLGSDSSISW